MKNRKAFVLNPSQSRRLIAIGVATLPQVQMALQSGRIFIGKGSTNAYVLEELYSELKMQIPFNKGDYVAGQIVPGRTFMEWTVNKGKKLPEIILHKGKRIEVEDRLKEIFRFQAGDLVIKGGNALDTNGIPGVLVGSPKGGGTIGTLQSTAQAKGLEVICPIGLEKLVFGNIHGLQQKCGIEITDKPSEGFQCGMIPMPYATVITEIQALETLFECEVFHISSGGVGGAEGCISIIVETFDEAEMKEINKFMDLVSKEPIYKPNL